MKSERGRCYKTSHPLAAQFVTLDHTSRDPLHLSLGLIALR